MAGLGVLVAALGVYLVYALINPENYKRLRSQRS